MAKSYEHIPIEQEDLTGFLAEVAEACGIEAVEFLLSCYGGETVSVQGVPRGRKDVSEVQRSDLNELGFVAAVADHFSMDLARTLIALRGKETIYIPARSGFEDMAKARRIRRLYNGRNAHELAQRFHLPARKVRIMVFSRPKKK